MVNIKTYKEMLDTLVEADYKDPFIQDWIKNTPLSQESKNYRIMKNAAHIGRLYNQFNKAENINVCGINPYKVHKMSKTQESLCSYLLMSAFIFIISMAFCPPAFWIVWCLWTLYCMLADMLEVLKEKYPNLRRFLCKK